MSLLARGTEPLTGVVGALVEAWAQLRIGRMRVLLSLIGVAVAVAAMTFTIALGQVSVSAINAEMERYTGRPGTVRVSVTPTGRGLSQAAADAVEAAGEPSSDASAPADPSAPAEAPADQGDPAAEAAQGPSRTTARISGAMTSFIERYGVESWATSYATQVRFAFPDGPRTVQTDVVSLRYGLLHHTPVAQGRWFSGQDEDDLSPSLVVSQGFLDALGLSSLDGPVTVTSYTPSRVSYTIVGVLEPEDLRYCSAQGADGEPVACEQPITAFALSTPFEQWWPAGTAQPPPTLEVWTGRQGVAEMTALLKQDLDAQFGQGSAQVTDNTSNDGGVTAGTFTTVVTGAGLFIMVLGALGLVNISMVTVRQRIHEIGVRRSFGATSRRIFFSIMLESVVATVVAGLVGIGIAVVAMRLVPLEALLGIPVRTVPPFPMSAALIGLLAATGVGALAGIVPAAVAVRIRPIDAIRY